MPSALVGKPPHLRRKSARRHRIVTCGTLLLSLWLVSKLALAEARTVRIVSTPKAYPELRRWLIYRALENGYTIVPRDGRYALVVKDGTAGIEIEVSGAETRHDRVEYGPAELVELEALQRAMLLLDEVQRADTDETPARLAPEPEAADTAGSEFSLGVHATARDPRLAALLDELSLAGVELRGAPEQSDQPSLCSEQRGQRLRLAVTKRHTGCSSARGVWLPEAPTPSELRIAAQTLAQDALPGHTDEQKPITTPPKESAFPSEPAQEEAAPSAQRASASVELGALWRGSTPDASLQIAALLPLGARFELAASGVVTQSRGNGIEVLDAALGLGAGFHYELGSRMQLHMALQGGALRHSFVVTDLDQGVRWDGFLSAPISVQWRLFTPHGVLLTLLPSLAGRAREHRLLNTDQVLWNREAWSIGLLGGGFIAL